jgi:hypothetical protein
MAPFYFDLTNRSSTNFLKSTFFNIGAVSTRLSRTASSPFIDGYGGLVSAVAYSR